MHMKKMVSDYPASVGQEEGAVEALSQESVFSTSTTFTVRTLAAWGVHIFTAGGIVAALLSIIAVSEGDWRGVFIWLFVALVIDGVDGTLARAARVSEVLPRMDGKMIDTVVDFTTYAIVPAYFFYQAGLAPAGWNLPCAAAMLLAAALYYGKEGMVSDDMHFVGFPVLWNVFVFFLFFIFSFPGWLNAALVGLFSILHFVPIKFAYPSRALRWRTLTLAVGLAAMAAGGAIIWLYPDNPVWLKGVTVAALAYFAGLAGWETFGYNK